MYRKFTMTSGSSEVALTFRCPSLYLGFLNSNPYREYLKKNNGNCEPYTEGMKSIHTTDSFGIIRIHTHTI